MYGFAVFLLVGLIVMVLITILTQVRGSPLQQIPVRTTAKRPLWDIWTDPQPLPPERIQVGPRDPSPHGRGIVLAAGGPKYGSSAAILVQQLRDQGCTLPIQWFYHGSEEMSPAIQEWLSTQDVTTWDLKKLLPFPLQHKFSLKVAAIYLSTLEEVLFLDADQNVTHDPTYLFETPAYQQHQVLFWPDYWALDPQAPCFAQLPHGRTMPRKAYYAMESGQMVLHRARYWHPLWCVLRILENQLHESFPLPCNHGDKDVFQVTWAALGLPFTMIPYRPATIGTQYQRKGDVIHGIAMGQHDPEGELLFIHQNMKEWVDRRTWTGPYWKYLKRFVDRQGRHGHHQWNTWNPVGAPTELIELDRQQERHYFDLWEELCAEPALAEWLGDR